ncbi:helix-turn-helix transcriptional regulator [Leptospira kmetyi]|uniref:Transcriptional regulator n=1 Tax=Leptospira kmetyi TaxID=408139 RepID=A0ABX4NB01_9LEPT|nr:helix-turn-helix transcriptional regulator [Leptospira kmetyi]EQA55629.1 DNA-binding helix-turn-helix protein [Leptospira kmetyi serovar Malaysia str. Bejo-Iso9]PJZ30370.1 transcriptional regulator [Leptospira kmetyi]PJZ41608.1 transcriptional regulator [Leptospira kmetyi]TGK12998.1 helix-turn-helix domain-containing protein [Leptospira kmetyi]TGK34758.1 helix-turn-helix domain-containing protein [Leptospira kmetyi]
MKNSLYIWDTQILYAAWEETTAMHSLYSASIYFSVERPSELFLPDGSIIEFSGVFIPPNTVHRQVAKQTHILNLNIDPDSPFFDRIAGYTHSGLQVFDSGKIEGLSETLAKVLKEETTDEEALGILQTLIDSVFGPILPPKTAKTLDKRISTVANHLRSLAFLPQPEEIKLGYLAKLVNLSEDRFRHLFKETLFTSVRKYILSLRLKIAARNIHRCVNLTEVAHVAGFSDSAHFSRTFRATYGHRPSVVFRNSKRARIRFIER